MSAPYPGVNDVAVFEALESNVRTYCRAFPTVFRTAKGARLTDEAGRGFIDFFTGAGALNYGHNPDAIRAKLIEYLAGDGVSHALDMHTTAKRRFLQRFLEVVLAPRNLDYKVQFCGPTGANTVEAALKLARLVTGRTTVCSFTGGWHGMTSGCLTVTAHREHRKTAGVPLANTTILPYPVGPYPFPNALQHIEHLLADPGSGFDLPAAFLLETVQAEGGIYVAPVEFLQGLRALCDRTGILLMVDDVQAGCGRTGTFFSFERAGIVPDVVCLSKSIGGYGLPMSLLLIRPAFDRWKPGQHTGTFRGNQLAFVAGEAALEYWRQPEFEASIARHGETIRRTLLTELVAVHPEIEVRGLGLLWGVDLSRAGGIGLGAAISRRCFERGLLVEACGRHDSVLKLLPPLVIEEATLREGLALLTQATKDVLSSR
ncbi:MAG: diaminobutyrate--2-oxoglutarate transaminase [Planctomycetes bacterium]|nr:diaminobutyrate--2-oxoglutarate transaminase [Planctomycetota bacterium]